MKAKTSTRPKRPRGKVTKSKPRNGKARHKPKIIRELHTLLTESDLRLKQKIEVIISAFDKCGSDKKGLLDDLVEKDFRQGLRESLLAMNKDGTHDVVTRAQGLRAFNTTLKATIQQEARRIEMGGILAETHLIEMVKPTPEDQDDANGGMAEAMTP